MERGLLLFHSLSASHADILTDTTRKPLVMDVKYITIMMTRTKYLFLSLTSSIRLSSMKVFVSLVKSHFLLISPTQEKLREYFEWCESFAMFTFIYISLSHRETNRLFWQTKYPRQPKRTCIEWKSEKKQIEMHTLKYVNVRGAKEESKLKQ